jgi:hypothetical protein
LEGRKKRILQTCAVRVWVERLGEPVEPVVFAAPDAEQGIELGRKVAGGVVDDRRRP